MKKVEMKIEYLLSDKSSWTEIVFIPDNEDSEVYCQNIIDRFNITRTSNEEKERRLIATTIIEENVPSKFCEFEKQNLVTRADGSDLLKCKYCGETYIRHGLHTPTSMICINFRAFQRTKLTNAFNAIENEVKNFKSQSWKQVDTSEHLEKIKVAIDIIQETEDF